MNDPFTSSTGGTATITRRHGIDDGRVSGVWSVELEGERAAEPEFRHRMRCEHTCFTTRDVDNGASRGLGRHLERLVSGSLTLWGPLSIPGERVGPCARS